MLKSVAEKRIYLSPPHLSGKEQELVKNAFDSNWIAPLGPHVDAFEKEMAKYLGIGNAVALNSGTAALHLALKLVGVKQGDVVVCPSLTFASCANVILYERAVPVFIDVNADTWTLNPDLLEIAIRKYQPKALISVDIYGQSADYDKILKLCQKYDVAVIEDAAEALGAEYNGKKCGIFGSIGVLSFNGNKIITTSGGGMLMSDDNDIVEKAHFLSNQAREPEIHYEHKELGYNYRMSNLLAAVGRGQLRVLDERVRARRTIFQRYFDALSGFDGFEFMPEADYACPDGIGSKCTRWLTTLTVDPEKSMVDRTQIIEALEQENIEARPVWKPMHLQPLYRDCDYIKSGKEDVSKRLFENGLCLPSGSNLSTEDQDRVIDIIMTEVGSQKSEVRR
ncbi:MAG: aminotransferase class I/II-fold pyridoxal phosphate-dependent enzyme [Bacteroidetes bacterium]|nr:aminotransferase class I/II-fold pyridoxal phosphate-dependent enzyme [Bacteroidota bacterium]